jgi:hypothetical protein
LSYISTKEYDSSSSIDAALLSLSHLQAELKFALPEVTQGIVKTRDRNFIGGGLGIVEFF